MNAKVLEEKIELLRWIINLNDEQMIKNLSNFKNEVFGVPFAEQPACSTKISQSRSTGMATNDPRLSPDYLKFGDFSDGFLTQFGEALPLEEAKKQSIQKIQGWWRD
ncbi:MAG: hypothetical protein Q4A00_06740 [Flavobacteriaceae bacterium]|nr:hypothetical protein [Flavobacteriaceae bacterium]